MIGLSRDDTGELFQKKRLRYKCCQPFAVTKNYALVIRDVVISVLPAGNGE